MFGAIFLFILYESFASNIDLSILAFFIAVPTFFLSFIKLIVNILEDVNDKITNFLRETESTDNDIIEWEVLDKIRDNDNNVAEIISRYSSEKKEYDWIEDTLNQYHKARVTRNKVRKIRRAVLYVYYVIFMLMLVMLLLHTEFASIISKGLLSGIDLNLFTIWSLIIVLLEIMMKDIFEDIIIIILDKKMGTNLEWY